MACFSGVEWGTVGEWVGGLGALVPGVLWFFERRDRRAAEASLRRQQIQGVHFREVTDEPQSRAPSRAKHFREWIIRNDSSAPLRSAWILGKTAVGAANTPAGMPTHLKASSDGSLGVNETRRYTFDSPTGVEELRVFVIDAAGVMWMMLPPGHFEEVKDSKDAKKKKASK
ncbi:hypothetical protein [Isoptericola sp. b408]|uniref:hypothetical protein n=1 Tax=Isoptericola sp. b408 TaxID=3064653 RepID=UPI0027135D01|nr:hypothetical protein [Isoptericola sp. b408]MDO8151707.1 hypothetical protein [Isoptericola sp. b408]